MRSFCTLRWRPAVVSVLCMSLLAWAGCSSSNLSGPTGSVSGKVTYQGTPLPAGTTVTFVHQDNATPAVGQVGGDGSYTLLMRGEQKVLTGTYAISVTPPVTVQDVASDEEAYRAIMTGQAKSPQATANYPEKYKAAETSGLTFTVQEGSNTCDLDLKDEE